MIFDKINDKKKNKYEDIIKLIEENKYITIPELAKKTKKSEPTIHRHLVNLMHKSIIKRVGPRKNGYWDIID